MYCSPPPLVKYSLILIRYKLSIQIILIIYDEGKFGIGIIIGAGIWCGIIFVITGTLGMLGSWKPNRGV